MCALGDDSASCSDCNIGTAVAITCGITFIVTLTATTIVTFLVTCIIVKKFTNIPQDTNGKQPTAKINPIIYEETDMELQPNPAYGRSHNVAMDTNPAYESYMWLETHAVDQLTTIPV